MPVTPLIITRRPKLGGVAGLNTARLPCTVKDSLPRSAENVTNIFERQSRISRRAAGKKSIANKMARAFAQKLFTNKGA